MISVRCASTGLAISWLLLACTPGPLSADEADTTAAESDTTESGTGDGECPEADGIGGYADWSIAIDGDDPGLGPTLDLDLSCTTVDDGDDSKLSLDCGDTTFDLTWLPVEWSESIIDIAGTGVHVRLLHVPQWGYADQWLRLDFVGEELSVFLINAENLLPAFSPWGLEVGQECEARHEFFHEMLVLERDGQTLELWPGESGKLGDQLEVWVDRSSRAPGYDDGVEGWEELEIVSRGHLAPGEVCDPDTDTCGPGLACCDSVCQAEDPETMQCPPPPP